MCRQVFVNYGALDLFVVHKLCVKHKYIQDTGLDFMVMGLGLAFPLKQTVCSSQDKPAQAIIAGQHMHLFLCVCVWLGVLKDFTYRCH